VVNICTNNLNVYKIPYLYHEAYLCLSCYYKNKRLLFSHTTQDFLLYKGQCIFFSVADLKFIMFKQILCFEVITGKYKILACISGAT